MQDSPTNEPATSEPAGYGGRLVVAVVLLLGVVLSGFGLWYHYSATRRSLDFWGTETAGLISRAPQVEIFELEPFDSRTGDDSATSGPGPVATVNAGPDVFLLVAGRDISGSKGLIHARAALVTDRSFAWEAEPDCTPDWTHALRFTDGDRTATVLFAWDCHLTILSGAGQSASLAPLDNAMRRFCLEQYAEGASDSQIP